MTPYERRLREGEFREYSGIDDLLRDLRENPPQPRHSLPPPCRRRAVPPRIPIETVAPTRRQARAGNLIVGGIFLAGAGLVLLGLLRGLGVL